jgi:putative effector of murein hydrolase
LTALIAPTFISIGVLVYRQRALIKAAHVAWTALVGVALSLVGTAAAAKAINVTPGEALGV